MGGGFCSLHRKIHYIKIHYIEVWVYYFTCILLESHILDLLHKWQRSKEDINICIIQDPKPCFFCCILRVQLSLDTCSGIRRAKTPLVVIDIEEDKTLFLKTYFRITSQNNSIIVNCWISARGALKSLGFTFFR